MTWGELSMAQTPQCHAFTKDAGLHKVILHLSIHEACCSKILGFAFLNFLHSCASESFVLAGHHHFITMKGGKRMRWLPLSLLAIFAAIEFATQYLFIATNFAEVVGIPASALHFIEVHFKFRLPERLLGLHVATQCSRCTLRFCPPFSAMENF